MCNKVRIGIPYPLRAILSVPSRRLCGTIIRMWTYNAQHRDRTLLASAWDTYVSGPDVLAAQIAHPV